MANNNPQPENCALAILGKALARRKRWLRDNPKPEERARIAQDIAELQQAQTALTTVLATERAARGE